MVELEREALTANNLSGERRSDDFGTPRSGTNPKGQLFLRSAIHANELTKQSLESRTCSNSSTRLLPLETHWRKVCSFSCLLNGWKNT
jgi:hypothetical protein